MSIGVLVKNIRNKELFQFEQFELVTKKINKHKHEKLNSEKKVFENECK